MLRLLVVTGMLVVGCGNDSSDGGGAGSSQGPQGGTSDPYDSSDDAGIASSEEPQGGTGGLSPVGQDSSLVGSWTSTYGQYLCIGAKGETWLGDSLADLTGPQRCTVDVAALQLVCGADEPGSTFTATLTELSTGEIHLEIIDCPADPQECEATYARDPDNPCDEVATFRGTLGARCDEDADCIDGHGCQLFYERGVCTRPCKNESSCPDNALCLAIGSMEASCIVECIDDTSCRYEGSSCEQHPDLVEWEERQYLCL